MVPPLAEGYLGYLGSQLLVAVALHKEKRALGFPGCRLSSIAPPSPPFTPSCWLCPATLPSAPPAPPTRPSGRQTTGWEAPRSPRMIQKFKNSDTLPLPLTAVGRAHAQKLVPYPPTLLPPHYLARPSASHGLCPLRPCCHLRHTVA